MKGRILLAVIALFTARLQGQTLEEIRAGWDALAPKSIWYRYRLTNLFSEQELESSSSERKGGRSPTSVESIVECGWAEGKQFARVTGDSFSLTTREVSPIRDHVFHDGNDLTVLNYATKPWAHNAALITREVNKGLVYGMLKPIGTHFPERFLESYELTLENFDVLPEQVLSGPHRCVVLRGIKTKHQFRLSIRILVDPRLHFAIREIVHEYDGRVVRNQKFDLQSCRDLPVVLSRSSEESYGPSGEFGSGSVMQVTDFKVNPPIDPERFKLELPIGTRVCEQKGRTTLGYFVQTERGFRRITEDQYGKIGDVNGEGSKSRAPIVLASSALGFAIVASLLTIWYRRRIRRF